MGDGDAGAPGRRIVVVSGAPGAGKSAVAGPLAARLGFPLLSKDDIKETLFDALGGREGDLVGSRRFGQAAMELLWMLAARSPCAVLEANFRPGSRRERDRLGALGATVVEVHCACPPEEAARRFALRAAGRHPVHALKALTPEHLGEFDGPIGLATVIEVDTTRPVAMDQLHRRVSAALAAPEGPG